MMRKTVLSGLAAVMLAAGLVPLTAGSAQAASYNVARCGNTSSRVLLTFDDWGYGDPYIATRIGKYLQDHSIRAAFFLIGDNAKSYPDIVKTLRAQGHWVGNHSKSHPDLTTLSSAGVTAQIKGGVASNVLRPPYGAYNTRVKNIASGLGYRLCNWTVDTNDWRKYNGAFKSASAIRSSVRNAPASAKKGGVILGHLDPHHKYVAAIPGIISDLHTQGYLFCRNRGAVTSKVPNPLTCT